jgi:exodeoxyribonuclease VII small subunit
MSQISFETALKSLEKIVTQLESGKLSLEASLSTFEEGMKLAQACQKMITKAEQKIELLTKEQNGDIKREPFKEGLEPNELC